jgi:uncharacterized phosphosugar-binding protein
MSGSIYPIYLERVTSLLKRIADEEGESILSAAREMADRIVADRLIYAIGPGHHSAIGVEEIFYRAGSLACISPLIDAGYTMIPGALLGGAIERTPGYATAILRDSDMSSGDVLLIVNVSGVGVGCIDTAIYARENGIKTIGITSRALQLALPVDHPARHSSHKNLCDLVDIVVDVKVPLGDAQVAVEGAREKMGPVSTIANVFALHCVMIETAAELARRGLVPPVWRAGNSPGGDEANKPLLARYRPRVKKL